MRRVRAIVSATLALATLTACGDDEVASVTPGEGPGSGYFEVRVDSPTTPADRVTGVRFGEQKALEPRPLGPNALSVLVQGSPMSGPASVRIETDTGGVVLDVAFSYAGPRSDHFARVVAIGASLSQGVQNGVPTFHGGLMSPPAQLGRQLGGYFPLPLLIPGFLREIGVDDIGPPPACLPPDIVAHVTESAVEVLEVLSQGYAAARSDPDITVANLAVGGSKLKTVLEGPTEEDFAGNFLGRLVLEPNTIGPIERAQIEHAEDRQPTLIVSTDLYGNDAAASLLQGDVIDPSLITPYADFDADLTALVERLAMTGAQVFLANMPRPSLLPLTGTKRQRMIDAAVAEAMEAGEDPVEAASVAEAAAEAAIVETDTRTEEMNARLAELADGYVNVHVVDLAAAVDEIAESGLAVGGQALSTKKFGGLLSLDGVHFTDTGYAMVANELIEAINAELGTDVPLIDLDRVVGDDAGSPKAIARAGLDVSQCDR